MDSYVNDFAGIWGQAVQAYEATLVPNRTPYDLGWAASPGGEYQIGAAANRGAFKTPGLRNVSLTAPYMHNGSIARILDVIRFYGGQNQVNNPELDPDANANFIGPEGDRVADFLLNGLTDCRVQHELAPFDHPALAIPNFLTLPAVGAAGNGAICP